MDHDIEQAGDYGAPIREHRDAEIDRLAAVATRLTLERNEARDALAAAERDRDTLKARIEAVERLIDPDTGMAVGVHGGQRAFAESDIRAALAGGSGEASSEHH